MKENVQADSTDIDWLVRDFEGCYGAFLVTYFREGMDMTNELKQIHNIADAAEQADLNHVVFSTLEDTREFIKGRYP